MTTRIARPSRLGCLVTILILILLGMMVGLIGLTVQMPRRVYTAEEQAWLRANSAFVVNQRAPEVSYDLFYSGLADKAAVPAKPIAFGARESHVTADLGVRYKEKDGATVTAYDLRFAGTYVIASPDAQKASTVTLNFPFPQTAAVLSEVTFTVDGIEPDGVAYSMQSILWKAALEPGQTRTIEVRYRAEGVGSFAYGVPQSQRMKDFDLQVTIRGAQDINIPESALAPTARQDGAKETMLTWRYINTITNRSVQVELPARPKLAFVQRVEKLGQFFLQLALAAPLLTALFLVCWLVVVRLEALKVAHEHTALVGIGFFLFYPLFIFSAGFVDLSLAFAIALVVAGALVIGYSVRVVGGRLVSLYLIPLLVVFYGLLTRGLTEPRYLGLMLVISSVILLALFMWRLSNRKQPVIAAPTPIEEAKPVTPVEEVKLSASVQEAETPVEKAKPDALPVDDDREDERYCVHCGQCIEGSFKFCPHCGKDTQTTRQCERCGLEYIPSENAPSYCPACGNNLLVS
jgi:hypothetical protein